MSNPKTNLEAVNTALPHEVRTALATIAEYLDSTSLIGPQASAADIARSRLAGVIDSLSRTVA